MLASGCFFVYTKEKGIPFFLYNVTEDQWEELQNWYPERFEIEYNRDVADYVYESEKLAKQKEDLKVLKESNKKAMKELTTKFQTKVNALNDELLKDKYSTKEIKKLTKDIKDISSKLIDTKISKKEGMRKILTTEQYNKIFKIKTHYDILADRLGLSPEQKEKFIKALKNKEEKEKILKTELREKDFALKKEFDKENIDKNVVTKLSEEISNISKDLFKLDIDTKMELKSILTPEQYKKFIKPIPNPRKPIIYEPTACDKKIDKK